MRDQNCHAQVQEVQANRFHGEKGRLVVLGGPHTLQACTTYCLACMHLEWPSSTHCCWCKHLFRSTPTDHRLRQGILCLSKHVALPIPSHHCFNLVARYAVLSTKADISSAFDFSRLSSGEGQQHDPFNEHFELLLRMRHFCNYATTQQKAGKVKAITHI